MTLCVSIEKNFFKKEKTVKTKRFVVNENVLISSTSSSCVSYFSIADSLTDWNETSFNRFVIIIFIFLSFASLFTS